MAKKKKQKQPKLRKVMGTVPYEIRLRIVQAVLRGMKLVDVAVGFGVSVATVQKYSALFNSGGADALRPTLAGAAAASVERAAQKRADTPKRQEVVATRMEHPEWGTRRIRDVLARFSGLGVSETEVRRILHEEGLLEERAVEEPRPKPERRFERAEPNQLWQSDIFTFELRRNQRLYVAAFLDDHSRYLVSWAMAHHQKSMLVIEAIERGIAEYGEPREVLTDQGRQYTAWRGKTDFEELLHRHGIAHVKSRPQHPQTLGKIERFWKSLWEEFLGKTVFADFADCQRRLALYVQHYNFQRPHQALDGLVPADRFFRAAPHVRAAVESQVAANALRLAQDKPPQKPFYLVGRLGDQDLSIAATGGQLRVQMGEAAQTIPLPKEADDETQASRIFRIEDEADNRDATTRAADAAGAALADRPGGSRSGGATALSARAVSAVGRETGDDRDHRARDLAAAVLPAGDAGVAGDAAGAGAGGEQRELAGGGEPGVPDRGSRGAGEEPGAGQAPARTLVVPDAQGSAARTGGGSEPARPEAAPALVGRWPRTFAWLDADDEAPTRGAFDPDAGWRDDAGTWRRKLAGAIAPTDGAREDDDDGAIAAAERAELPAGAGGSAGAGRTPGAGTGRAGAPDLDERGGAAAGHRAEQHADDRAPGASGDDRSADAAAERPDPDAGARARAGTGSGAPAREEREAGGPAASSGRHDGGGGRDHPQPAWTSADEVAALLDELDALAEGEAAGERRGPRAADSHRPGTDRALRGAGGDDA
jgi:transposase InsO family protein